MSILLHVISYYSYFIERKTRVSGAHVPDVPTFAWSKLPTENGFATVKVDWVVNPNGKPGSHFYVKYRCVFMCIYVYAR